MAAQTISRHLTVEEVDRLEFGLPRLAQWSGALLVPFTAHRLCTASVAWINRRWFLERGFDLAQERILRRVSAWIVDEFAWHVPNNPEENLPSETRTLWADRYGSTSGQSPHGGSGRVATIGCFQAKGIGRTPLVGRRGRQGYSHGCSSLSESLREAIYADVFAAEFPHGAVPVIAVLDTGLNFTNPNRNDRYEQNVRRGILIRPAVIRPAHAERAPLFKRPISEFVNRQTDDVQRTRDVIATWVKSTGDAGSTVKGSPLAICLRAVAEQIAFGQVQRLFAGGYFSSNVTIFGELLDFGDSHVLPNWENAWVLVDVRGFGDEMQLLPSLIGSLAYYFTKYQRHGEFREWVRRLIGLVGEIYEQAWRRHCLSLFQAERLNQQTQDAVHRILRQYFAQQQRRRVIYRYGKPASGVHQTAWLHDALVDASFSADAPESRTLEGVAAALREGGCTDLYRPLSVAARLLMPRTSMDRRALMDNLAAVVARAGETERADTEALGRLVREAVCGARRHWPRLPAGQAVLAHATLDGSSALLCAEQHDEPGRAWLEGIRAEGATLHWFGHRFEQSDFKDADLQMTGAYWSALCPVRQVADGIWKVQLHDVEVPLPPMDVWYRPPAGLWLRPSRDKPIGHAPQVHPSKRTVIMSAVSGP